MPQIRIINRSLGIKENKETYKQLWQNWRYMCKEKHAKENILDILMKPSALWVLKFSHHFLPPLLFSIHVALIWKKEIVTTVLTAHFY